MASRVLMFLVIICCIGAIFSLETLDAKISRKSFNPYMDFERKDVSDLDLDDDIINIALGDHRTEVWSQIVMTPELKANKMSLNRKNKRVKENKVKLHGKKEEKTPFDKHLPERNVKN